ncbi:Homeodomain-like protein, partial [Suillus plorans]
LLRIMVNRRISNDLKECALTLWDHGWEVEDICEVLGVSWASCFHWRNMFEELGTVARPPSPLVGRTRIITQALMTAVKDLFAEESDLFLDKICTWLAVEYNITISSSALSRNLKQVGLS